MRNFSRTVCSIGIAVFFLVSSGVLKPARAEQPIANWDSLEKSLGTTFDKVFPGYELAAWQASPEFQNIETLGNERLWKAMLVQGATHTYVSTAGFSCLRAKGGAVAFEAALMYGSRMSHSFQLDVLTPIFTNHKWSEADYAILKREVMRPGCTEKALAFLPDLIPDDIFLRLVNDSLQVADCPDQLARITAHACDIYQEQNKPIPQAIHKVLQEMREIPGASQAAYLLFSETTDARWVELLVQFLDDEKSNIADVTRIIIGRKTYILANLETLRPMLGERILKRIQRLLADKKE